MRILNKFFIYLALLLLTAPAILNSCVSPYQPKPGPSGLKTNNWTDADSKTFNNQCTTEMSVLRMDLDQKMVLDYCTCALSQVAERYSFQQLRIDTTSDPQIQNIDQVCIIQANLPPDPAGFGGPSFGGQCDNAGSYEEKLSCLGLPAPVLPTVPWRR